MSKPWSDLFRDVYTFPKREVKPNYRNWDLNLVCQLHFLCCLPLGQLCTCFYLMETKSCNRSLKEKKSNQKKKEKRKTKQPSLHCFHWPLLVNGWLNRAGFCCRQTPERAVCYYIIKSLSLYCCMSIYIYYIYICSFLPHSEQRERFQIILCWAWFTLLFVFFFILLKKLTNILQILLLLCFFFFWLIPFGRNINH